MGAWGARKEQEQGPRGFEGRRARWGYRRWVEFMFVRWCFALAGWLFGWLTWTRGLGGWDGNQGRCATQGFGKDRVGWMDGRIGGLDGWKGKTNILLVYLVWHWSFNRELLVLFLSLVLSFTCREHLPRGDESLPSFFPGKG